jgi:NAD(P)-dependent dehydrogenase (short-subunit alcohol dehydrogenase family)
MIAWTIHDIPPQEGRLAVVTGTGGLGYETALALTGAGARVVLAGRNEAKGHASVLAIRAARPGSDIAFASLDLANLASIADFARRLAGDHDALDLLINNAGVMTPPKRRTTSDGFELQFGTNYLGHFALTARLLGLLRRGSGTRVVTVSSGAHLTGAIRFDDLQWEREYRPWLAYSQSKLANLMFAFELQLRGEAGGWGLMSNAAHPGYARTDLIANGPGTAGPAYQLGRLLQPFMSQTAAAGALPTLYAATAPQAIGGGYYGPIGFLELRGPPGPARVARQVRNLAVAARLWETSERLTGVAFDTQ